MSRSPRILIVEDDPADAELMILAVREQLHPVWERVDGADGLRTALATGGWDVILCDYSLPGFGAVAALELIRAAAPGVPVIIVSGTIGEAVAVDMMRAGASDYVLKASPARLGPAIERELREAAGRRVAEQDARRLAAIVRSSDDAIIGADLGGRITDWNPGAERLYGWSAAEALGRPLSIMVPSDRTDDLGEISKRLGRGERVEHLETVRVRKDGSRVDVSLTVSPMLDDAGNLVGTSRIARDISDRKRAEQEARERAEAERRSAALIRALVDALPAHVALLDDAGVIVEVNLAWRQFAAANGYQGLNFGIGSNYVEVCRLATGPCSEGAAQVASGIVAVLAGRQSHFVHEYPCHAPGEHRWFRMSVTEFFPGRLQGAVVMHVEITDRWLAVQSLRESEERLRLALTATGLGIFDWDVTADRVRWDDRARNLLGFPPNDGLPFAAFLERVRPDDRRTVEAAVRSALDPFGTGTAYGECRVTPTGDEAAEPRWVVIRGQTRFDGPASSRRPVRFVGTVLDVTERRTAEAGLRLRDRAIRAVHLGVLITDFTHPDNPVIYASPGVKAVTGYAPDEVVGRNCRFLQGKDTDPEALRRLKVAIKSGEPCTIELLNYRRDGSPFWNELSVSPVRDEADRIIHFVGVQADVTARRQLEEQLRQSQKMEAIGRLAGGVAHDFNNLLTIINGYSDLILAGLPPGDPNRPLVAEVRQAGQRSAGLTRQLLAFSRRQVIAPRFVDLNRLIADAEPMLRRLIGEDIRLTTNLAADLGTVRIDPGQFEQVLMNLVVNARDAMPTGGSLGIRTLHVEDVPQRSAAESAGPHSYVLVSVTDTGAGMTPDVKARLFEPFFTTKGPNKGTGLGLATVFGIIQQADGFIDVASTVGAGSTFDVYLPRAAGTVPALRANVQALARGTETVLLVEDDDGVRTFISHVLGAAGYTVLTAADGDDARTAIARQARIHLLITDVVMPRQGGREVAERVRAAHPAARILFISGYTDDAVVRHGVLTEGVNFLQKPFTPSALAAKVREVLDRVAE